MISPIKRPNKTYRSELTVKHNISGNALCCGKGHSGNAELWPTKRQANHQCLNRNILKNFAIIIFHTYLRCLGSQMTSIRCDLEGHKMNKPHCNKRRFYDLCNYMCPFVLHFFRLQIYTLMAEECGVAFPLFIVQGEVKLKPGTQRSYFAKDTKVPVTFMASASGSDEFNGWKQLAKCDSVGVKMGTFHWR